MSGWFSLEAVYAKKGDSLILHYGTASKPRWILIDGGHNKVYDEYLKPRLEELRLSWAKDPDKRDRLPLYMVMVSHADADHLQGILDLTEHMLKEKDPGTPDAPVTVDNLWFNGFEDLIAGAQTQSVESVEIMDKFANTASAGDAEELALPTALRENEDFRAVVASTKQGRQLLKDAKALAIEINAGFGELVMRGGDDSSVTKHPGGLTMKIVGPDKKRIDKLRTKWKADLKKILAKEKESANAASFSDASPFNLSSTIVLVERGTGKNKRTMLLTGDARGDDMIQGLKEEGLLDQNGKIHVDIFKLPHHGSDRNVKDETFRDITAEHYLISANGEHGNPEPATLDMLVKGRAQTRTDKFKVYFTFPDRAYSLISEEKANKSSKLRHQKDALLGLDKWLRTKKPDNMEVFFRDSDRNSIAIDLDTKKVLG